MSELACSNGGGKEWRLAEAEAAMEVFSDLSDLSLFIDILRRKPHFPVLVDVPCCKPADREADGGESSRSAWLFMALAIRRPSFAPTLPEREPKDLMLTDGPLSGLNRVCVLEPKTLRIGLAVKLVPGLDVNSDPADLIFRNPFEGGSGRGEPSSAEANDCIDG